MKLYGGGVFYWNVWFWIFITSPHQISINKTRGYERRPLPREAADAVTRGLAKTLHHALSVGHPVLGPGVLAREPQRMAHGVLCRRASSRGFGAQQRAFRLGFSQLFFTSRVRLGLQLCVRLGLLLRVRLGLLLRVRFGLRVRLGLQRWFNVGLLLINININI